MSNDYLVEEAAKESMIRKFFPSLGRKLERFPVLTRNLSGKVIETGETYERQIAVFDYSWLDKTDSESRYRFYEGIKDFRGPLPSRSPDQLLKDFVYLEDEQMYQTTPYIFQSDCPWSLEEMRLLSWKPYGAGRISTSFAVFQILLLSQGYRCLLLRKLPAKAAAPSGYPLLIGATGNY
ncbi:MAG: hypothetical protein K2X27_19635 [Candidatus Obscuribacterales bacterium]|nr:hypothetical protein [Candidatus Obscuribacterales bacterium]